MLDKKKIQGTFLFEFKMGKKKKKTLETTGNINISFGPVTTNGSTVVVRGVLQNDESLEDEECSSWPSEVKLPIIKQLHENN